MAAGSKSDKMAPDMEVRMEQKSVTEFLLMGKNGDHSQSHSISVNVNSVR